MVRAAKNRAVAQGSSEELTKFVPGGEELVHWVSLISEPIDAVEQVLSVVDAYCSRRMIGEFFKAIARGGGRLSAQLKLRGGRWADN